MDPDLSNRVGLRAEHEASVGQRQSQPEIPVLEHCDRLIEPTDSGEGIATDEGRLDRQEIPHHEHSGDFLPRRVWQRKPEVEGRVTQRPDNGCSRLGHVPHRAIDDVGIGARVEKLCVSVKLGRSEAIVGIEELDVSTTGHRQASIPCRADPSRRLPLRGDPRVGEDQALEQGRRRIR
ncbi:MAG TPA: hypothetical protein VF494_06990 [Candidatus Limnocylindrales bacterium]